MDDVGKFYDKLNQIGTKVEIILQKISCLDDHESRLRKIETFYSKALGALLLISMIFGAVVTLLNK